MKRAVLFSLTDEEISQKRVKNSKDRKEKPEVLYSPDWYGYQDDTRIIWVLQRDSLQVYSVWENGQPVDYDSFTSTLYSKDADNVAAFIRNPPWRNEEKSCFGRPVYSRKTLGVSKIPVYRRVEKAPSPESVAHMNFEQRHHFQQQFQSSLSHQKPNNGYGGVSGGKATTVPFKRSSPINSNAKAANNLSSPPAVKETCRIYECVGWMDLGNFIVVVERPQRKNISDAHIPFSSIIPIKAYLIDHHNGTSGIFENDDPLSLSNHVSTFLANGNKGTKLVFHAGTMMTPLLTEMIQCLFSSSSPSASTSSTSSSPMGSFDSASGGSSGGGGTNGSLTDTDQYLALLVLKKLSGLVLSSCKGVTPNILRMLLRSSKEDSPNSACMGPSDVFSFLDEEDESNTVPKEAAVDDGQASKVQSGARALSAKCTAEKWRFAQPTFRLNQPFRCRSRPSSFNQINISEVPLLSVIVSLDLSFSQLDDDCFRPLAAALLSSGSLHTLNLSGNMFKITGAKFLALGLEGNTSLRYLDISGNHFNEGIDEISKAIGRHPKLEVLMLDACRLGVRGALALATYLILPGLCPLKVLSLTNNDIGSDGYAALQSAIAAVSNRIDKEEDMEDAREQEEIMKDESNKISFLTAKMTLGEKSYKYKQKDMTRYRGITKLNVAFNGISKITIPRSILNGLQVSAAHCIKYLDLSNNSLNDAGCLSLSQSLPCLPGLNAINLSYNMLGIKGLYPLMTALPFMKIQSLNLKGNPLDTACMWALAFTLSNDHHLNHLDISESGLSTRTSVAGHFSVALLSNPKTKLDSLDGVDLSIALKSFGIDQGMLLANYGGTVHPKSGNVRNSDVIRWIREFKTASEEHAAAIKKQKQDRDKLHHKEIFYQKLYQDMSPSLSNKKGSVNASHSDEDIASPLGASSAGRISGRYRTKKDLSTNSNDSYDEDEREQERQLKSLMGHMPSVVPRFQQQFLQQMQQQHLFNDAKNSNDEGGSKSQLDKTTQDVGPNPAPFSRVGNKRCHSRTKSEMEEYPELTLAKSMLSLFIGEEDDDGYHNNHAMSSPNEDDGNFENVFDDDAQSFNMLEDKSGSSLTSSSRLLRNSLNFGRGGEADNTVNQGDNTHPTTLRDVTCGSLPLSESINNDLFLVDQAHKNNFGMKDSELNFQARGMRRSIATSHSMNSEDGEQAPQFGIDFEPCGPPPDIENEEDQYEVLAEPPVGGRPRVVFNEAHNVNVTYEEEGDSNSSLSSTSSNMPSDSEEAVGGGIGDSLEDCQRLIELRNKQNNINIKPTLDSKKSFSQFRSGGVDDSSSDYTAANGSSDNESFVTAASSPSTSMSTFSSSNMSSQVITENSTSESASEDNEGRGSGTMTNNEPVLPLPPTSARVSSRVDWTKSSESRVPINRARVPPVSSPEYDNLSSSTSLNQKRGIASGGPKLAPPLTSHVNKEFSKMSTHDSNTIEASTPPSQHQSHQRKSALSASKQLQMELAQRQKMSSENKDTQPSSYSGAKEVFDDSPHRPPRKVRGIVFSPPLSGNHGASAADSDYPSSPRLPPFTTNAPPPPFKRCIFHGIPDRFYDMVSGTNSPSQNKSNQNPSQMISLMQYVPFDEAEIDTLVELFQFRNPGGPLLPHSSNRRGGIDALPNQELPRSLIQQGENKQMAAKMAAKQADRHDEVVVSTRRKELSELRAEQAATVPGSEELAESSGFITKSSSTTCPNKFEQNWSSQLFDKAAFPELREHVESCLSQRMYMDALVGMREMFYGSLYRGAGGWCTRRVLIVDDSKVIRNFLKRMMESGGYTTDVASNGGEALVMMQDRFYDMVFLDLEMPVMNGLDCATAMRQWEESVNRRYRQPMCAVSSPSISKKLQALGAGFNHYQHKPVQKKMLLDIASSRC